MEEGGEKWRLQGSAEGEGGGLRQGEDDRLDAIIATDEYIQDMENKIKDLEEIEAEVIEELKDDEDCEGSGRYMQNMQPPSGRYSYYEIQNLKYFFICFIVFRKVNDMKEDLKYANLPDYPSHMYHYWVYHC